MESDRRETYRRLLVRNRPDGSRPRFDRLERREWIGGGNDDLVLYSPYLAIFDVKYAVAIAPGSARASFVYGANDSRLMDKYKNIYQVESGKDQSYIKLELDISAIDGITDGKAKLNVYRAGYKTPTHLRARSKPSRSRQN